jgi:hypothetical protein
MTVFPDDRTGLENSIWTEEEEEEESLDGKERPLAREQSPPEGTERRDSEERPSRERRR